MPKRTREKKKCARWVRRKLTLVTRDEDVDVDVDEDVDVKWEDVKEPEGYRSEEY